MRVCAQIGKERITTHAVLLAVIPGLARAFTRSVQDYDGILVNETQYGRSEVLRLTQRFEKEGVVKEVVLYEGDLDLALSPSPLNHDVKGPL
jgi:hypothetical protein